MRALCRFVCSVMLVASQIGAASADTLSKQMLDQHLIAFESDDGTQLSGYFFVPDGAGPFDTVLMMHGCAGLLDRKGVLKHREAAWLTILAAEGYAVLLADSFTARGYRSICKTRTRPIRPDRERPHDAYGALRWLQAQPTVRVDRVALIGWSNGAMSMLWALYNGAEQRQPALKHDFRAAIGFYPGCIALRRRIPTYKAKVPILLQIGLADDWTLPEPCMALIEEANHRGGARMTYDAYESAYHGFDHPSSRVRTITTKNSSYASGGRTVHIGTNEAARFRSILATKAYLRKRFAD